MLVQQNTIARRQGLILHSRFKQVLKKSMWTLSRSMLGKCWNLSNGKQRAGSGNKISGVLKFQHVVQWRTLMLPLIPEIFQTFFCFSIIFVFTDARVSGAVYVFSVYSPPVHQYLWYIKMSNSTYYVGALVLVPVSDTNSSRHRHKGAGNRS